MDESPTPSDEEPILPARLAPQAGPLPEDCPAPPRAPACDPVNEAAPARSSRPSRPVVRDEFTLQSQQHRQLAGVEHARHRRRRLMLPVVLFVLTCVSTFWVGCEPTHPEVILSALGSAAPVFDAVLGHWRSGLTYMTCVLAILFAHEMGHFLMTLRYRIAASFPYFLPVPFTPIGTMGAVISMDGLSANRRQIFDIGLAGPIAGLLVAIPITWYGVGQLELPRAGQAGASLAQLDRGQGHLFHMPPAVQEMTA
ncbi:MAG: site-2 protease family protein, partial [Planctomycetales bacterium]|nr:site-2 protease family protein [Planctomycetales bacterium]